jgi:hypothetical protein
MGKKDLTRCHGQDDEQRGEPIWPHCNIIIFDKYVLWRKLKYERIILVFWYIVRCDYVYIENATYYLSK